MAIDLAGQAEFCRRLPESLKNAEINKVPLLLGAIDCYRPESEPELTQFYQRREEALIHCLAALPEGLFNDKRERINEAMQQSPETPDILAARFQAAIRAGMYDLAKETLAHPQFDPNLPVKRQDDAEDYTALMIAAMHGAGDLVDILLGREDITVALANMAGKAAIHLAMLAHHEQIVRKLEAAQVGDNKTLIEPIYAKEAKLQKAYDSMVELYCDPRKAHGGRYIPIDEAGSQPEARRLAMVKALRHTAEASMEGDVRDAMVGFVTGIAGMAHYDPADVAWLTDFAVHQVPGFMGFEPDVESTLGADAAPEFKPSVSELRPRRMSV